MRGRGCLPGLPRRTPEIAGDAAVVHYSVDPTGRFAQRPFYPARELDDECERVITALLMRKHGRVTLPIDTEDLKVLIEQEADELDCYADLTQYGPDAAGVTE